MLSKIKKKDRTPAQQKAFDRIRMKRSRKKESPEAKQNRLRGMREHAAEVRKSETEKLKQVRLSKISEKRRSETKEQN